MVQDGVEDSVLFKRRTSLLASLGALVLSSAARSWKSQKDSSGMARGLGTTYGPCEWKILPIEYHKQEEKNARRATWSCREVVYRPRPVDFVGGVTGGAHSQRDNYAYREGKTTEFARGRCHGRCLAAKRLFERVKRVKRRRG